MTISIKTIPCTPLPTPENWYARAARDFFLKRAIRSLRRRFSTTSGFEGSSVSSDVSSSRSKSSRSTAGISMGSSSSPALTTFLNFRYVSDGDAFGLAESESENCSRISPDTLLFFLFFFLRFDTRFDLRVYQVGYAYQSQPFNPQPQNSVWAAGCCLPLS